ncbi:MAG: hypothetical protein HXY20_02190, partial [Acidobacteria bacterium]|nr:hypothetical protein [Acidobacteriota bacterium]
MNAKKPSAKAAVRNLVGASLEEIEEVSADLGEPRYRARQIYAGIYRLRYRSWDEFSDLPETLRRHLKERFTIIRPRIDRTFTSQDGTRRYLLEVPP